MTIQLTINLRAVLIGVALLAVLAFSTPFAISLADDGDDVPTNRVPLGSSFTYQGRLELDGVPVTGNRTLRFTLRSDAVANTTVGTPQTQALTVTDGQFAAALDFGVNAFDGQARWVDVEVETSPGVFAMLPPRQPLTATPYALFSQQTAAHSHFGDYWSGSGISGLSLENTAAGTTGLFVTMQGSLSTAIRGINNGDCSSGTLVCYGVYGRADAFPGGSGFGGVGVRGDGTNAGVLGTGTQFGVYGRSSGIGVQGYSEGGTGVYAISNSNSGVNAAVVAEALGGSRGLNVTSVNGIGALVTATNDIGVYATGVTGVVGYSNLAGQSGVYGSSSYTNGIGVSGNGSSNTGTGVKGTGNNVGVWGELDDASGWAGYFEDGGVWSDGGFSSPSDLRLKHSVRDLQSALTTVMALRPVRYEYNERPGEHIGLIAQEVQEVLPELVTVDPVGEQGMLSLNYDELIPVLIKAIQEQQVQIAAQQAEIDALRAAIE